MPVVCLKMHTNRCKCSRRGQTSTLLVLKWKRVSGIPAGPCMVFSGELRRRELEPCNPDLLGGNRSHGNADCDVSRESGTNLTSFYGAPAETGAAHWRNHMHTWLAALRRLSSMKSSAKLLTAALTLFLLNAATALAQPSEAAGEANLRLPDLSSVSFLGMTGHNLLLIGLLFCAFGLLFGMAIYMQLKNLPVHRSMREISELIYETCKT